MSSLPHRCYLTAFTTAEEQFEGNSKAAGRLLERGDSNIFRAEGLEFRNGSDGG